MFCCIILDAELFHFSHFGLQICPSSRAHVLSLLGYSSSLDFLPASFCVHGHSILNPSRSNVCHHPLSLKRSVTSPSFLSCVVCRFFQHPVQSCLALCLDKLQWITPTDHGPDLPVLFHLLHNGFWVLPAQPHLSWSPLHVLPLEVATQLLPVAMQRLSISFQILYGEKYFI